MAHFLFRLLLGILCLTISHLTLAQSQGHDTAPGSGTQVSFRINDLTNEERDMLARALGERGDARIAFACVPAGILILEATEAGRTVDGLRLRALPGLLASVSSARIQEEHLSMENAEALCATSRSN